MLLTRSTVLHWTNWPKNKVSDIIFLNLEQVLAIHHDQVTKYGGLHGIRDLNLLISAISRPQASFAGEDLYTNIFLKAAALVHSLVLNHSFIDGNKRTAIVSAARFLFINGYRLKVGTTQLVDACLNIKILQSIQGFIFEP